VFRSGLVGTSRTYHTAVKASYSHEASWISSPTLILLDTINSRSTGILSPWKVDDMHSLLEKNGFPDSHVRWPQAFNDVSGVNFFISCHTHFLRPRFIRAMLPTMWCGTTNSMMIQCPKLIRLVSSIAPSLGATAPCPILSNPCCVFLKLCFSVPVIYHKVDVLDQGETSTFGVMI